MIYLVCLASRQAKPLRHRNARKFIANDPRDAAVAALNAAPVKRLARRYSKPFTLEAIVWAQDAPKHENGCPVWVHGFTLKVGA